LFSKREHRPGVTIRRRDVLAAIAGAAAVPPLAARSVSAQTAANLYAGQTIHSLVGLSAGGGADAHMRLVARYLGRHLPGRPTIVPQNMTGANGLILANYLSNVAPRDGSTIALLSSALLLQQAVGKPGVQYDLEKLNWLGSASPRTVSIIVVSSASGIDSIDAAKQREIALGGIGVGGITSSMPRLVNDLLGTKFKIVTGYPGSPELDLAIERGEVHGRHYTWSGLKANHPDWIANIKAKILLYAGEKPADLNGVPSLSSLAPDPSDRLLVDIVRSGTELGFPFVTTPDVPADRVAALRDAFESVVADPDFIRDGEKVALELGLIPHTELEAMVHRVLTAPADLLQRARRYVE
jgi:tripartite-type tricarboxylate transporter receptor subunit TctC